MNREELIEKIAIEFAEKRLDARIKQLTQYYKENHIAIEQGFLNEVECGVKQCVKLQKKIGYVVISILNSSLLTKTYNLQIAFYNMNLYADEEPVCVYWAPTFFYENVDADMEELGELLRKQVVRFKPYELYKVKYDYINNFYFLIIFLIKVLSQKVIDISEFNVADKEEVVKVLFGKYMEKQMEMCVWEA